jgi:multiple sugar transport system permease protein
MTTPAKSVRSVVIPARGEAASSSRAGRPRRRSDALPALGFLTPFLALLLVFQYVPLVYMARNSFFQYSLFNPGDASFVGVQNYIDVFTDPDIVQSLIVTLIFIVGLVVLVIPISFLLAVYLNGRLPARALVRVMVFLPVVTSAVVVATLWTFLLNETGLINALLHTVGIPTQGFLTDKSQALPALIVMSVWQQVGLATVLFIGGLQGIPPELLEAAQVDGATGWQRMTRVTLPLVSRSTMFIVVMMTVFGLQAFAPAYVMTGGAPNGTTNLVIYQIYKMAFQLQQPGPASALSIVVLAFAVIVSLVQMRLLRSRWNY